MAINVVVSVQFNDDKLLLDIIKLFNLLCHYYRGNVIKTFCLCILLRSNIINKRFDIFSPFWGDAQKDGSFSSKNPFVKC